MNSPPEYIVVDLDDFCDAFAGWALPLLDRLHDESGGRFRATLFAIPARTSDETLHAVASRPWLELGVHGWNHIGPECSEWDAARTREVLAACHAAGFQHDEDAPYYASIFKAPHWIGSQALYHTLRDAGWAVAEHPRNLLVLPRGLRRYVLSPDHRIGVPHRILPVVQAHGHFTNDGVDNGLREHLDQFRALRQWGLPYAFVSEVVS